jgi:hypothetical protein
MSIVTVVGDPDKVCGVISSLITAGNAINEVKKTKNNATYIIDYVTSGPPPSGNFLLMEDGSYLLLESGDKIILE